MRKTGAKNFLFTFFSPSFALSVFEPVNYVLCFYVKLSVNFNSLSKGEEKET